MSDVVPSGPLYDAVKTALENLKASLKEKLADGHISILEGLGLVRETLGAGRDILAEFDGPAEHKRLLFVGFCLDLWDELGEPLDIWGPDAIIDPVIRQTVNLAATQFANYLWPE
jgi:hypothetical protein